MTTPLSRNIGTLASRATDRPYTADSAISDAIKRGRQGVALLFDDAGGPMQVVKLGNPDVKVRHATEEETAAALSGFESYEQMGEEAFKKAAARSHEPGNRTAGKFPPIHQEGKTVTGATGDAAALDARRKQMTADAKRFNQEAYARNERIAQQMKAASDKQWKKSA